MKTFVPIKVKITEDEKGIKVFFDSKLREPIQLKVWLNYPENIIAKQYTEKIDKLGWYIKKDHINDVLTFLHQRKFDITYFGDKYQPQTYSPPLIPYEKRIKRYSAAEISQKRAYIHDQMTKKGIQPNFTSFNNAFLNDLYKLYDSVFFEGCIAKRLKFLSSTISFKAMDGTTNIYGRCDVDKCDYTMTISVGRFINMFKSNERILRAGGVNCKDRLECLQITFEHELMHIIIMIYKFVVDGDHGLIFQCMMEAFFNQHGLYPEYSIGDVYERLSRDTARVGMNVKFKKGEYDMKGKIIELLRNTAKVQTDTGEIWVVKYSMLIED